MHPYTSFSQTKHITTQTLHKTRPALGSFTKLCATVGIGMRGRRWAGTWHPRIQTIVSTVVKSTLEYTHCDGQDKCSEQVAELYYLCDASKSGSAGLTHHTDDCKVQFNGRR